jgi:hypothetical protein
LNHDECSDIRGKTMTKKEFVALEKNLLPNLPGFSIRGSLMFLPPVKETLRGFSFEGSSFDKTSFYVNMFVLPLCVPTEYLYFNFGNRVRHGRGADRWSIDRPDLLEELGGALKRQALEFLRPIESLFDFVKVAKSFPLTNINTREAIAYSLVRVGEFQEGRAALGELLQQVDTKSEWQRAIAERAETLDRKLALNPVEGQRQVENWEAQTLKNLDFDTHN